MCTNEEYKQGEYSSTVETQYVLKLNILLVLKGSRGFMIRVEDLGVKSSMLVTPVHERIIRAMPGIQNKNDPQFMYGVEASDCFSDETLLSDMSTF